MSAKTITDPTPDVDAALARIVTALEVQREHPLDLALYLGDTDDPNEVIIDGTINLVALVRRSG